MDKIDGTKILPGIGWHHEDVKAELRKRYGSMAAFAKEIGLSRQGIWSALANPLASIRTERLIAGALGVPPNAIWPTRWQVDGKPVSRKDRMEYMKKNDKFFNKQDAA